MREERLNLRPNYCIHIFSLTNRSRPHSLLVVYVYSTIIIRHHDVACGYIKHLFLGINQHMDALDFSTKQ